MVLQLDFDVGKRDDGKVHVHAAVAQFDHLGGESRVCRFHIAVAGFVYQAEKVGFRQQEIIHGSVNFENYTLFSACAHEYNWAHPTNPVEGCADANPKTELPNDT